MLDALKGLAGGRNAQKQAEELEALLERAREEREALSSVLTRIAVHSSTLAETSNAVDEVHRHVRQSQEELRDVRQSIDQAAVVRGELEQLAETVKVIAQDYSKARDISREADDDAFAAREAVKDIEKRLGGLGQLQELGRTMEEKLAALNSLAEHVAQNTRILEGRKDIVDRAVAETNQVNELLERMGRGEEMLARVDALSAEARTRMEDALQSRLIPLETRLTSLQDLLEKTSARVSDVQRTETTLVGQEVRLRELMEKGESLAANAAERLQQVQELTETLAQAGSFKDHLIDELSQVHTRQREALGRTETAEEQLRRTEAILTSLERRLSQLLFSEKKLDSVEGRMGELTQMALDVDARISALAERDAMVAAVKAEIESVHQIAAKGRDDLQYVTAHREQFNELRRQIQDLVARTGEVEKRIAEVDTRRRDRLLTEPATRPVAIPRP